MKAFAEGVYNAGSSALRTVSSGYVDAGQYSTATPEQEVERTRTLDATVNNNPGALVNDDLVGELAEAQTPRAAEELVKEAGVAMGMVMAAPNPELMTLFTPLTKDMTRVQIKEAFKQNAQTILELGSKSKDPLLMALGGQNLFLAETVMKVKLSDHVKDALEKFAKGAGAVFLAAAVAVGKLVEKAAKAVEALWEKTKPARDKIKQVLTAMATEIARVTKPARDAIKKAAQAVGTELGKAGRYVAEKAKAAGVFIGKQATAAKDYLASTQIGKAAANAARQAGKKMADLGAKAKIAVAGGIAGAAAKIAKSAEETKQAGQGHFAKKVTAAVRLAGAKNTAAKLRETLKRQGVSLETRQQAAPYQPGAKPRDKTKSQAK